MPLIISGVSDQNYASDLVLVWRESRINGDENNNVTTLLLSSIVRILSPSFSIKLQKVLVLILLLSLMK